MFKVIFFKKTIIWKRVIKMASEQLLKGIFWSCKDVKKVRLSMKFFLF